MNNKAIFIVTKEPKESGSNQQLLSAVIDGEKCKNSEALLAELARVLKFPAYFGANYDALFDMLNDLSWITQKEVIISFKNTDALLQNNDSELITLLKLLCETLLEAAIQKLKNLTVRLEYSERIIRLLTEQQFRYKVIL